MTNALDITYVPITELHLWPGNARQGDVERIKKSMKTHGVFNPLIVQKSTGKVMIGNHRLMALTELHEENPHDWEGNAPVAYYDVDDLQAEEINLIDNKLSDDAGMDEYALVAQLQRIHDQDDANGIADAGYTTAEYDDLIKRTDADDLDALADEYGEPDEADLWPAFNVKLPPAVHHRLLTTLEDTGAEDRATQVEALLDLLESRGDEG